jgi:phosphoribosyl-ATP pyrophosphohydrolase/phosphoribosyl-AMP cyclohydrolase
MIESGQVDWDKMDGLVPAIVQDDRTGRVLMLGYMNRVALDRTLATGLVTFFSRSKRRLWTKGETSGHQLRLVEAHLDCDSDSLLIRALPQGPTCHRGTASCFGDPAVPMPAFLSTLAGIISERATADPAHSYTARLMAEGVQRIAQKVGEEGVEVALAAMGSDPADLTAEAADLLYHLLLLLKAGGSSLEEVIDELRRRHAASSETASS